ncbi:hypothetical protein [Nocardiopsis sp. JB363]|uniref:hypothetical protein n=1 Tax=Nocardiopsis sp. JB363 TaxID=1434837 RepID=UPI00097B0E66|nr:hypothetical protein [Nocardiopsis sp. JB363]SIO85789.1 hypothetical protein BQ8420_08730 [Nocardiopsis sp. JB363]
MGNGTGANTGEAHSGGVQAEPPAQRILGTSVDFEDAISDAGKAAGNVPGVTGWSGYSGEHADSIRDVEDQCVAIAGNTQAGAEEISRTDHESGGDFSASGGNLSRPINVELY